MRDFQRWVAALRLCPRRHLSRRVKISPACVVALRPWGDSTALTVREQGSSLILIAPRWPSKHWVAEIIQLLADEPWPLPIRRDLLSQAGGEIYHPHPDRIALWAWPVRGGT
ncbi:hypothetical protein VZT92_008319 [Zoarces viviparus]|uniref:Uncharacterized protein n=1 Tax=Zoarces viviparus TaxID=48416 RepID=A0AAW1FGE1_ZOAVI